MSNGRALFEFRWSRPKQLTEIAGTSEALRRLSSAASQANESGRVEVGDDCGTVVLILRDEGLQPPKNKGWPLRAIVGLTAIFYMLIILLAMIGAYTAWKWLFSA